MDVREKLIDLFQDCNNPSWSWFPDNASMVELVDYLLANDVTITRHGRWKCTRPCPVCVEDRFKGLDADIWADWEPPYCPNCGARMEGDWNG